MDAKQDYIKCTDCESQKWRSILIDETGTNPKRLGDTTRIEGIQCLKCYRKYSYREFKALIAKRRGSRRGSRDDSDPSTGTSS